MAAGVAVVVLLFLYASAQSQREEDERRSVTVTVSLNPQQCQQEFPLLTTITNGSKKKLLKVEWTIEAHIPGHSTNLADYLDNDYSNDTIMAPGYMQNFCYRPPKLTDKTIDPKSVEYSVGYSTPHLSD